VAGYILRIQLDRVRFIGTIVSLVKTVYKCSKLLKSIREEIFKKKFQTFPSKFIRAALFVQRLRLFMFPYCCLKFFLST